MPLISVVIPVYNGERTIRETIESVLNQSFDDFELVIIDDGSTDTTLEIVSSFTDPRIKLFSYSNAGLAASRNRGISVSTGEYISFIDADDLWTSDKLKDQLQALLENKKAAIAYSWTDCIDENSNFLRPGGYITVNGDAYAHLLLNDILENGSNALIQRKVFDELGGFDESLKAAEDWDMWLRIAKYYHFVTVPLAQILYRETSDSMSNNLIQQKNEMIKVIKNAFEQAPPELKLLQKSSYNNIYQYLIYKCIEGESKIKKPILALDLLLKITINQPKTIKNKYFYKVFLKSIIFALLPNAFADLVIQKLSKRYNLVAMPIYQYHPF